MSTSKTMPGIPAATTAAGLDERQPLAFEHRIFLLKTLYEASGELATANNTTDILNRFLPTTMGPLGLTFGFALLLRPTGLHIESLGFEKNARAHFERTGAALVTKFFPEQTRPAHIERPCVLVGRHLAKDPHLPPGTNAVIAIPIDATSHAVLGFGPKLTDAPISEVEDELLRGLAANLSLALRKACNEELIKNLNSTLSKKNQWMEQALARMQQTQEELARRAFQLMTLYETAFDLSGITDPQTVLYTFILRLMGTFSYSNGWIALYGPGGSQPDIASRNLPPETATTLASAQGRNQILARFVELKDKMPRANQSYLLSDHHALKQLPAQADTAVLFAVDEDWHGAIGLGHSLSGDPMDEETKHLLLSLAGTFLVTLANTKRIQMIERLNTDLAARNTDLLTTLDKLTSAKHEISLLTETRQRIIGLVQGEVARVRRASWLDVSLIIIAGAVLGLLFNLTGPSGIDLIPPSVFEPAPTTIAAPKAHPMIRNKTAVIIDARPAEFHKQGHIPQAVNLPQELFDFVYSMKLADLAPETPLIIYGRTISRHYDAEVARELELLGHENIMVLKGGLAAWENAGYEVTR